MKSVVIPSTERPMWECEINGIRFAYPAGTVQSVPDEVASVIANVYGAVPVPAPAPDAGQVWTYREGGPVWESIPAPEKELPPYDNGKYLKSTATGVEWATPSATVPDATLETAGVVRQAHAVADAESYEVIVAQFNTLLSRLVDAGILQQYDVESGGMVAD